MSSFAPSGSSPVSRSRRFAHQSGVGNPPVKLACSKCAKTRLVERDPTDPPNTVTVRIICPSCDDGDRHSPEYFDAAGNWLDPFGGEA